MSIKYRPDIDGLRAFAVLSVLMFHYFPKSLPGGFVGVDIFFVISGFLIGAIIIKDVKNRSFSFISFYKRRALRIFPALSVVLVFCYLIGWSSLYQNEFALLGKHIAAGAGFASNLLLWSESGYFDVSSTVKPLLHLWSLGIEEQFYLISPVILLLSFRYSIGFIKTCAFVFILSFIYCLYTMMSNPTANYYSPISRFWELMCGVFVAILIIDSGKYLDFFERNKNIISFFGFAMVVLSFFVVNDKMPFPGYIALVPVVGACLIIASGPNSIVNEKILSKRFFVFIGLISYPLYLWHWPLLTYARIIHGEMPDATIKILIAFTSILLSCATYYYIEKPIRTGVNWSSTTKAKTLTFVMLCILSVGLFTYKNGGVEARGFNLINPSIASGYINDGVPFAGDGCGISDDDRKIIPFCNQDIRGAARYALIGDSKSMALLSGVMRSANDGGYWIYMGGNSSTNPPRITMPVLTDDKRYSIYQEASKVAINSLAHNENIKIVVYMIATRAIFQLNNDYSIDDLPNTNNYDVALNGLVKGVSILQKSGKKVVFVIDNPTLPHPEDCLIRKTTIAPLNTLLLSDMKKCYVTVSEQRKLSKNYLRLLNEIKSRYPDDVYLFDTVPFMCEGEVCSHKKDGHFMYSSSDHISNYAAGIIGKSLNDFLTTIKIE